MLKFNRENLLSLLKDFYNLTDIKICVYDEDFNEIIYYPEKLCKFCDIIRSSKQGREKCAISDYNALTRVKETGKTFIYKCHTGLTEALTPIFYTDIIIGYIMVGQVLENSNQIDLLQLEKLASDYQIDQKTLSSAPITIVIADKLLSACHILETLASYLYLKKQVGITQKSIIFEITSYIDNNINKTLTVDTLCSNFLLSRSELYSLFKQYHNTTVAEHIKNKRVEIAKNLLLTTDLNIKKIATKCGIDDYNYLSKVFKKATGLSPREYRNMN